MEGSELVGGVDYAHRDHPQDRGEPLRRVTLVGPVKSGKARVRWRDGELVQLEQWLPTRTLLCPWVDRKAFLVDERRLAAIKDASDGDFDPVLEEAANAVLAATGENEGTGRVWITEPARADRLWSRARLPGRADDHPLAFKDRHGQLHLPFETVVALAKAFAAAEPNTIAQYLTDVEDEYEARGWEPGNRWAHKVLRELRPAHALVRAWSGEAEVEWREKEIERLRILVLQAVSALDEAGAVRQARSIERALAGR